jgi:hypothetical protein
MNRATEVVVVQNGPIAARELTAQEAVALVRPTGVIGMGIVTATPVVLLNARPVRDDWPDVAVGVGSRLGAFDFFPSPSPYPNVRSRSGYYGGGEREYQARGVDIRFVTSFFRHDGLPSQHLSPRVMMTAATSTDAQGIVSLSLCNGAHFEEFLRVNPDPDRLLVSGEQATASTSLSPEHASLICLQLAAVVEGPLKSRIIGGMNPHAVVTMPRHLTGVIVTGYGSADLGGRTVKERAQLLIGIAHLQFRDELSVAAGSLGL